MNEGLKDHPINRVWDAIQEIMDDGSFYGRIHFDSTHAGTGRATFRTEDGRRFMVNVTEEDLA